MSRNKVAIVTGASRGIGAAIARELAAQGFAIAVNYASRRDGADTTVEAIVKAGGSAMAIQGAVQDTADLDRLFAAVQDKWGRLDVLVNNAGVGATAPLDQIDAAQIDAAVGVNLKGMLLASQRAARAIGPDGGSIVNVSSALAAQPMPGQVIYAATKAAIESATRVLAQELGGRKIRVNAVAPGPVETDLLPLNDDMRGYINSKTPLGRVGQPVDIAKVIAFLVSEAGGWITGQVIGTDGGLRL
ncbi:MAG: glucose 1-dehydrogenase [Rhizomicrobium sp.]